MELPSHNLSAVRGRRSCCIVCDEPLRHHGAHAGGGDCVCPSPHCRHIASRRTSLAPSVFDALVAIHRRHQRERRAREEEAARRLAERRAIEATENGDIRDRLRAAAALPGATCRPVALPTGLRRVGPLPEHRRQAYRAHLESIVAEALAKPGAGDTGSPENPAGAATIPLAAELCACCGGGCCTQGGERAYLNADSIRRVLRTHVEWRPEQVADHYLARLAPETIVGSCVNQTATGCSLPREMRSDTCNDFHCPSLRSWHAACAGGDDPRVALVIQRGFDHWTQLRSAADNPVTGVYIVSAKVTRKLE
jgi:hypothetical protein